MEKPSKDKVGWILSRCASPDGSNMPLGISERADQEVFKLELMVERDTSRTAVHRPRAAVASVGEGNPMGTFTLLLGALRVQEHI